MYKDCSFKHCCTFQAFNIRYPEMLVAYRPIHTDEPNTKLNLHYILVCCFDIGCRHMFSALDCATFSWCISRAVRFPSCSYTDACPGVESLVGGNSPNYLRHGSWCLFCAWLGLLMFPTASCFTHDNIMNSHVVLFVSTGDIRRCFMMYILCRTV